MKIVATVLAVLAGLTGNALAQREDISATPRMQPAPEYPVTCQQALGPDAPPQNVSVMFRINRKGETENIRVRETTHECFTDEVVTAIRRWRYNPRRVGNLRVSQDDMEVTFTFVLEEPAMATDFDARPIKRVPPQYPVRCMRRAKDEENVLVQFDVTVDGTTENISIVEASNRCLNEPSIASVRQWKYSPKILEGEPVARKNVQTLITFLLADRSDVRFRLTVRNRLVRAQNFAVKKEGPRSGIRGAGGSGRKVRRQFF